MLRCCKSGMCVRPSADGADGVGLWCVVQGCSSVGVQVGLEVCVAGTFDCWNADRAEGVWPRDDAALGC